MERKVGWALIAPWIGRGVRANSRGLVGSGMGDVVEIYWGVNVNGGLV